MRFYAVCHTCCVVTDDYTKAEIKNNKHIDNLISDFKTIGHHICSCFRERTKIRLLKGYNHIFSYGTLQR